MKTRQVFPEYRQKRTVTVGAQLTGCTSEIWSIAYACHIALDLLTWCHMVASVGTRNLSQMATYFSLSYRLLFGRQREANIL